VQRREWVLNKAGQVAGMLPPEARPLLGMFNGLPHEPEVAWAAVITLVCLEPILEPVDA